MLGSKFARLPSLRHAVADGAWSGRAAAFFRPLTSSTDVPAPTTNAPVQKAAAPVQKKKGMNNKKKPSHSFLRLTNCPVSATRSDVTSLLERKNVHPSELKTVLLRTGSVGTWFLKFPTMDDSTKAEAALSTATLGASTVSVSKSSFLVWNAVRSPPYENGVAILLTNVPPDMDKLDVLSFLSDFDVKMNDINCYQIHKPGQLQAHKDKSYKGGKPMLVNRILVNLSGEEEVYRAVRERHQQPFRKHRVIVSAVPT